MTNGECKLITARVIEATGARFDHFSPSGESVFLNHSLDPSMVLSCASHHLTGISIAWQGPYPPNEWFKAAAKAGQAVTTASEKQLEDALRKCHRNALRDKFEMADLEIKHARVECQAFTRDGGGVTMSIWLKDE